MGNLLLPFALSFTAGLLCWQGTLLVLTFAIPALIIARGRPVVMFCGLALGLIWAGPPMQLAATIAEPRPVRLVGVLTRAPRTVGLTPRPRGWQGSGLLRLPSGEQIQLQFYSWPGELGPGDRIEVCGLLAGLAPARNPGQFDRRAQAARQGIQFVLRVRSHHDFRRLRRGGPSLSRLLWHLRQGLGQILVERFAQPTRGLLAALLLGHRSALPREVSDSLIQTGLIHFVAVSGLHLGLVAWLLYLGLSSCIARPGWVCLLTLVGAAAYAGLTGLRPPVLRALAMTVYCLGARFLGRRVTADGAFGWTLLVSLLWHWQSIFSIGFQLSFAAVLAILSLSQIFGRTGVAGAFGLSCAAWLGTAPLIAGYFYRLAPLGALLSPVYLPLLALLLLLGMLELLVGHLFSIAPLIHWLAGWLVSPPALLTRPPAGLVSASAVPWWLALLFYWSLLGRLCCGANWTLRARLAYLALAIIVISSAVTPARPDRTLTVELLDVGHGLAVYLRLPDGKTVLYDAGSRAPDGLARSVLLPALRARGVAHVDLLILSHSDQDHVNASRHLLRQLPVNQVWVGARTARRKPRLLATLGERAQVRVLDQGLHRWQLGDVRLTLLVPLQHGVPANESSMVLRVDWRGQSILLTGDLEGRGLQQLLPRLEPVTVLLVPHPRPEASIGCWQSRGRGSLAGARRVHGPTRAFVRPSGPEGFHCGRPTGWERCGCGWAPVARSRSRVSHAAGCATERNQILRRGFATDFPAQAFGRNQKVR